MRADHQAMTNQSRSASLPRSTTRRSIAALTDNTPASRERYVDFLRAGSIAVVVFGHWLMAVVTYENGELAGDSALRLIPWAWALTWVLQVMPLFFFVGGFSNAVSLDAHQRRGGSYAAWLLGRIDRLMRPTSIFVAVWLAFMTGLYVLAPGAAGSLEPAAAIIAKPLWFLAVYVFVVALAPTMLGLHRRFGGRVLMLMAAAAIATDVARFSAGEGIGWLNFAFVWLFAHQLGFFYADGRLVRLAAWKHAASAIAALVALVSLTFIGPYSKSMVGGPVPGASNNSPPSVVLIALTIWLVGGVMLARPKVSQWLERRRVWGAVIGANSMIMTLYLWHLTALLVAAVTLLPAGFPQPEPGSLAWWALRPLWLALLVLATIPFVWLCGRFERAVAVDRPPGSIGAATASTVLLVLGLAGFATAGFADLMDAPAQGLPVVTLSPLFSAAALFVARFLASSRG